MTPNEVALNKRKFADEAAQYFNSAALGPTPILGRRAKSLPWEAAVNVVREKFGKLIGVPTNTISIFHNTTACVQRILLRLSQILGRSDATLLLTDLEYPGIVSAVDETWPGRVVMARVANLIWNGDFDRVTDKLKRSILVARPTVVYLSHVARATGYRIDESVVDFIRLHLPKTIIIDGAQACGNVHVTAQLLAKIDFYVTSGHKWLCGKPTLGLVYALEHWDVKDPAQSYSMARGSTGTGSADVIESLQNSLSHFNGELNGKTAEQRMIAIQDHNRKLTQYFYGMVRQLRLGRIAGPVGKAAKKNPPNGIATIVFDSKEMVEELGKSFKFTPLEDENWRDNLGASPPGKRYFLDLDEIDVFSPACFKETYVPKGEGYPARFCFHYYHTQGDVNRLIARIRSIKKTIAARHRAGARRSHRKGG